MEKRPLSVTIIAWFLIVTSLFSAFAFWTTFNNPLTDQVLAQSPLPRSVHLAFAIFAAALNLVIGVALLKRRNWRGTFMSASGCSDSCSGSSPRR